MKISQVIETLKQIQVEFGDIAITGGAMMEDGPLRSICVTEAEGMEIWPCDPNGLKAEKDRKIVVDGVFLQ